MTSRENDLLYHAEDALLSAAGHEMSPRLQTGFERLAKIELKNGAVFFLILFLRVHPKRLFCQLKTPS